MRAGPVGLRLDLAIDFARASLGQDRFERALVAPRRRRATESTAELPHAAGNIDQPVGGLALRNVS